MAVDLSILLGGFGGVGGIVSGAFKFALWLIGGIIFIVLCVLAVSFKRNKKQYNIPVTIWIPRSDGKIVDEIKAKGGYFKSKSVGGITTFRLKRKGVSTIDIPPPASRFLVGLDRHLYLVQKGMDDFEPVIPESFLTVETEQMYNGKAVRRAVINLKCRNQEATAWQIDNAENAKKRFTLMGLWEKYKEFIEMIIFVFIVAIMIYINWSGLREVVMELGRLVDVLVQYNSNCPMVS